MNTVIRTVHWCTWHYLYKLWFSTELLRLFLPPTLQLFLWREIQSLHEFTAVVLPSVLSSSRTSHCGTMRSKRAVEMKSEMMLSGKQRYRESVHLGALLSSARHQAVRNGGKRQEMNWDARTHSICKVMISLALISNLWMLFCCTRSCVRLRPELPSVDPQPRGQTGSETG